MENKISNKRKNLDEKYQLVIICDVCKQTIKDI